MPEIIKIHKIELADSIAEMIMDQRHPDGWMGMTDDDPDCERILTDDLQDEFGDLYTDILEIIENSEIK